MSQVIPWPSSLYYFWWEVRVFMLLKFSCMDESFLSCCFQDFLFDFQYFAVICLGLILRSIEKSMLNIISQKVGLMCINLLLNFCMSYIFFFFFWLHYTACGTLILWQGIEPGSHAGGVGLIPGWGTKIPYATQCSQKWKKKFILFHIYLLFHWNSLILCVDLNYCLMSFNFRPKESL